MANQKGNRFRCTEHLAARGLTKNSQMIMPSAWLCFCDLFTFSFLTFHHEKLKKVEGDACRTRLLHEFTNILLIDTLVLGTGVIFFLEVPSYKYLFDLEVDEINLQYCIAMGLLATSCIAIAVSLVVSLLCMTFVGFLLDGEMVHFCDAARNTLNLPMISFTVGCIFCVGTVIYLTLFFVDYDFTLAVMVPLAVIAVTSILVVAVRLVRASYIAVAMANHAIIDCEGYDVTQTGKGEEAKVTITSFEGQPETLQRPASLRTVTFQEQEEEEEEFSRASLTMSALQESPNTSKLPSNLPYALDVSAKLHPLPALPPEAEEQLGSAKSPGLTGARRNFLKVGIAKDDLDAEIPEERSDWSRREGCKSNIASCAIGKESWNLPL